MAIYKQINSKGALSTHSGLRNCLKYILIPEKTDIEHTYVIGTYNGKATDAEEIYRSFIQTKRRYNADKGRQYAHSVISFHQDEKITPEQALSFAIDFGEKTYEGHEVAIAVHCDKEHIHCHMVTNTVSYLDGSKLHKSNNDLQGDKDYCNELCQKYGLTVAEKGKHFDGSAITDGEIISWDKDTYRLLSDYTKKSYVADCGIAFMESISSAQTKDDFIKQMQSHGWQVDWKGSKKHIVFKNADGKKVRDSNLFKTFHLPATKELITVEFDRKSDLAGQAERIRLSELEEAGRRKPNAEISNNRTKRGSHARGI
ncbi:MAG TPA: hypothetical protein DCY31_06530 [Ruminococcaceae bacterium]|nr:hypothetical protein [Oscillospiraceae bacterium]